MSGSLKPICVPCQRFYRVLKNGVWFLEGKPKTDRAPPGLAAPGQWEPYKLWRGDLWVCDGCSSTIISGVGREPLVEHYMPHFKETVEAAQPFIQVNDC
jgi:hypothetical protein